jgi:hypothetical protein
MAAGKFHFFNTAVKYIGTSVINLEGSVIAVPLTDGFDATQTASYSAFAQFNTEWATASGSVVTALVLSDVRLTASGGSVVKWAATDLAGFSAGGDTITSFKYLALLAADSATAAARTIGFIDLNTDSADASVGNSTQVNITWATGGIAKLIPSP